MEKSSVIRTNRRRFGKIESGGDNEPDWGEIFWRIRNYWPDDDRFNERNFGCQPTWLILEALHHGAKLAQEKLHNQELGVATLTACFVNSNRDPKKSQPAKPSDFFYFQSKQEENIQIPAYVAAIFFDLLKDGIVPSWVVSIAPIEQLRKAKPQIILGKFSERALVGKGIFLLCPKFKNGFVSSALTFVDDDYDLVKDVDKNLLYNLVLQPHSTPCWILEGEWQVKS